MAPQIRALEESILGMSPNLWLAVVSTVMLMIQSEKVCLLEAASSIIDLDGRKVIHRHDFELADVPTVFKGVRYHTAELRLHRKVMTWTEAERNYQCPEVIASKSFSDYGTALKSMDKDWGIRAYEKRIKGTSALWLFDIRSEARPPYSYDTY
jgi:hypothetical protein